MALYDECEKLLVCRVLKKDETVTSGETLVFGCYLVDIGGLEGDNKPESDSNVDRKHKNNSRFRTPSGTNFLIVSLSSDTPMLTPLNNFPNDIKLTNLTIELKGFMM